MLEIVALQFFTYKNTLEIVVLQLFTYKNMLEIVVLQFLPIRIYRKS